MAELSDMDIDIPTSSGSSESRIDIPFSVLNSLNDHIKSLYSRNYVNAGRLRNRLSSILYDVSEFLAQKVQGDTLISPNDADNLVRDMDDKELEKLRDIILNCMGKNEWNELVNHSNYILDI